MIRLGNRLIRINPNDPRELQYSDSGGSSWSYLTSEPFRFLSLMDNGSELLAETSDGLYYSTSEGQGWSYRGRS